jgi:hypothetical protein
MVPAGNVVFATTVDIANKLALALLRPKLEFRNLIKLTVHSYYFYQPGN